MVWGLFDALYFSHRNASDGKPEVIDAAGQGNALPPAGAVRPGKPRSTSAQAPMRHATGPENEDAQDAFGDLYREPTQRTAGVAASLVPGRRARKLDIE